MQSFEALSDMLRVSPSSQTSMRNVDSWMYRPKEGQRFVLRPNTTFLAEIRTHLPNVPEERLARPFIHAFRHDTLMDPSELKEAADGAGLGPAKPEGWLQHEQFDALLNGSTSSKTLDWIGKQNGVVLLNTGAHWSSVCLGVPRDDVATLAAAVVRLSDFFFPPALTRLLPFFQIPAVLARFTSYPSLDVIYRTTSPGHPFCERASTPVYPALPVVEHPSHENWSWGSFESLNQLWKREIDRIAPHGRGVGGGRVAVLDIKEMAGQRPDAHIV